MGRLDLNDIREMFSCSNHTRKDETTSEPVVRQKYIALDIYIISKKTTNCRDPFSYHVTVDTSIDNILH